MIADPTPRKVPRRSSPAHLSVLRRLGIIPPPLPLLLSTAIMTARTRALRPTRPIPRVLVVQRVQRVRGVADTGARPPPDLVQREERVHLHDGEVVAECDERGYVNDVLGSVPEMREELDGTRAHQPDEVGDDDVPFWKVR